MSVVNALNLTGASLQGLAVLVIIIRSPLGDRARCWLLKLGTKVSGLVPFWVVMTMYFLGILITIPLVVLHYIPGAPVNVNSGPARWPLLGVAVAGPLLYKFGDQVFKSLLERVPNDVKKLEAFLAVLAAIFGMGVILQIIAISIRS